MEKGRRQDGDDEGQGSREPRKVAPLDELRRPVREALRDGLDASQSQVARDRDRSQQGTFATRLAMRAMLVISAARKMNM